MKDTNCDVKMTNYGKATRMGGFQPVEKVQQKLGFFVYKR